MTDVTPQWKESTRSYADACAEVDRRSGGRCEWEISPRCTRVATVHHHRLRRGKDPEHRTLVALCWYCHRFLHDREPLAYRMGWLIRSKSEVYP